MNWWLRAHAATLSFRVLTASMLLAPLLGGSSVPIPSLLAGMSAGIPVALVLPAVPAAVVLQAINRVPRVYDTNAVRPVAYYRAGMLAAVSLMAIALGLGAAGYAEDPSMSFAVTRNLLGYLGAGLIAQYLVGRQYGPLTVALVPVLCALVGLGPGGRPFPWTWPLHEGGSPIAAASALLLLILGITAVTVLVPRRRVERRAPSIE
ncbi:MAG TPA: hypothetical protein VIS29_23195 [Streptomyces sp.]